MITILSSLMESTLLNHVPITKDKRGTMYIDEHLLLSALEAPMR